MDGLNMLKFLETLFDTIVEKLILLAMDHKEWYK